MEIKEDFPQVLSEQYKKYHGVDINFHGSLPKDEQTGLTPFWLGLVISELVMNLPIVRQQSDLINRLRDENIDLDQIQKAVLHMATVLPHNIEVTGGKNFALISDDFDQENAAESMATLAKVLESDKPMTTKKYSGGVGLSAVKDYLAGHNGCIQYRRVGNRIVTIVRWRE